MLWASSVAIRIGRPSFGSSSMKLLGEDHATQVVFSPKHQPARIVFEELGDDLAKGGRLALATGAFQEDHPWPARLGSRSLQQGRRLQNHVPPWNLVGQGVPPLRENTVEEPSKLVIVQRLSLLLEPSLVDPGPAGRRGWEIIDRAGMMLKWILIFGNGEFQSWIGCHDVVGWSLRNGIRTDHGFAD